MQANLRVRSTSARHESRFRGYRSRQRALHWAAHLVVGPSVPDYPPPDAGGPSWNDPCRTIVAYGSGYQVSSGGFGYEGAPQLDIMHTISSIGGRLTNTGEYRTSDRCYRCGKKHANVRALQPVRRKGKVVTMVVGFKPGGGAVRKPVMTRRPVWGLKKCLTESCGRWGPVGADGGQQFHPEVTQRDKKSCPAISTRYTGVAVYGQAPLPFRPTAARAAELGIDG